MIVNRYCPGSEVGSRKGLPVPTYFLLHRLPTWWCLACFVLAAHRCPSAAPSALADASSIVEQARHVACSGFAINSTLL